MRQLDWSLLHPELIQFISEKIFCITDYVYFRAVCWGWRLASLPKPRHLPPQLPWLLFPKTYTNVTEPEILFYDLYRSKMSTLCHPVIQGSRICGASRGWLILEKYQEVFLLNPVTGASVPVSSLSGVPNIFPIPENSKLSPTDWILEKLRGRYMWKAILTSTPSPDSGCMVVGVFTLNWEVALLAFCRIGDGHWTIIEVCGYDGYLDIQDISWHHNLLYAIDSIGGVYIYDLYSPSKQHVVPPGGELRRVSSLVEGASEPMLVVMRHSMPSDPIIFEYEVFKWRNGGQPAWHQVHDIGKVVIFTNLLIKSISIPCANLQSNRWRGNKICSEMCNVNSQFSSASIELRDLENGDAEVIADLKDLSLGDAVWVTPSYF